MRVGRLILVVSTLVTILVFPLLLRDAVQALRLPSAYAAPSFFDPAGRVYQNGNNDDDEDGSDDNNDESDNEGEDNDNDAVECFVNLNDNEPFPCDFQENDNDYVPPAEPYDPGPPAYDPGHQQPGTGFQPASVQCFSGRDERRGHAGPGRGQRHDPRRRSRLPVDRLGLARRH